MSEVQVLEAKKTMPNSRGRSRDTGGAIKVERIRVAAYCRVSTDGDEQLGSFESQKLYYEDKIRENPEWVNAGIFADEAITGTKTDKREGFLEMITRCQRGEIDMILTKSISRFARNTVDTLNYVRMLRSKNIAVFFEKDYIKKRPYTIYGRFSYIIILYIVLSCCILILDIVPCRLLVA